jgi:flagellar FliJ protein
MNNGKVDKAARFARSAQDQSAQSLKASQHNHQQKCTQLEQLQQFKREYETRLETLGEQGIEARQLQDYRNFLHKLNQAIDQQNVEIHSAEHDVDAARQQWLSKSQRSSALDHLVDQQQLRVRQAQDKSEQRESDEASLTRHSSDPAN